MFFSCKWNISEGQVCVTDGKLVTVILSGLHYLSRVWCTTSADLLLVENFNEISTSLHNIIVNTSISGESQG